MGVDSRVLHDVPVYPRERGRRHSFPPPSSYSTKNTPRWTQDLPSKIAMTAIPFSEKRELLQHDRILPCGDLFKPPPREGDMGDDFSTRHVFLTKDEFRDIRRRLSGSIEQLIADTVTARHPAFITPLPAPRRPPATQQSAGKSRHGLRLWVVGFAHHICACFQCNETAKIMY